MATVNKTQHIIYDENKNEILNYFETSADQVKMDDSNVKTTLGSLSSLATTVKTSVINAINELHNRTLGIKGITTSTSVTETGYAADATTVAALNTNLQPQTSGVWNYIKMDNGTLICWTKGGASITPSNASGNTFYSSAAGSNYPVAFISAPSVQFSFENDKGAWATLSNDGTATKTPTVFVWLSIKTQCTGYFDILAIGKWK